MTGKMRTREAKGLAQYHPVAALRLKRKILSLGSLL